MKVIRLLLRFFPAAWRVRYGDELVDLVEDTGVTPRIALDLMGAGMRERGRTVRATLTGGISMAVGPAWRHPTAWAVVGLIALAPTLLVLAMSMAAPYQIARAGLDGIANSLQSTLSVNRALDLLIVTLPALAAVLAAAPLLRFGYARVDGVSQASLSVRLRAVNVVVVLAALVIGGFLVGHIVFESVLQLGS